MSTPMTEEQEFESKFSADPEKTPWEQQGLPVGFAIHDGAVPSDLCQHMIEWLDDIAPFKRSRVGHGEGHESDVRTSENVFFPFIHYDVPEFVREVNGIVYRRAIDYAEASGFSIHEFEDPSVQRYNPGQYYDLHHDSAAGTNRICSGLLYLNTVEEGGETEFPFFRHKIEPVAGRLAIFPASYPWKHRALPPTRQTKYAIAYFMRG